MLVEFSTFPLGKSEDLSEEVSKSMEIIEESGLDYELTAMGTILEGDWDLIMETIKKCHMAMRENHDRVETSLKIDDRVGAKNRLTGKVESVKEKWNNEEEIEVQDKRAGCSPAPFYYRIVPGRTW